MTDPHAHPGPRRRRPRTRSRSSGRSPTSRRWSWPRILGIPISAVAYGFLALVAKIQSYLFDDLPHDLFTGGAPAWWPVPWLVLCGLLTALTIRYLPGNAGHSPAFGFKAGGGPPATGSCPASSSPR